MKRLVMDIVNTNRITLQMRPIYWIKKTKNDGVGEIVYPTPPPCAGYGTR